MKYERFSYTYEPLPEIVLHVRGDIDHDQAVIDTVEAADSLINLWGLIEGDELGDAIQLFVDQKVAEFLQAHDEEMRATGGIGYDAQADERWAA